MNEGLRNRTDEKENKRPGGEEERLPDDLSEIDPADFVDPEEFGYRRRGFDAPRA